MRALRSRTIGWTTLPSPEGQQLRGQDGRAIGRLGDRLDAVQGGRPIELALGRGIQVRGKHLGVPADREEHVVEVVGDAAGQPADRFELLRLEEPALCGLACRDVDDRREDLDALGRPDRREADLDGELGAVLAPARQVEPDADRPRDRVGDEVRPLSDVAIGHAIGKEHLHGLPEQLIALVAERGHGLRVDVRDVGVRVDRDDRVGRRFEDRAKAGLTLLEGRLGRLARGDPGADVDDGRKDLGAIRGLDRAEADLDGEFRSVLAAAGQVEADADGSWDRMGEEAVTVPDVTFGGLVRQEQLHQVAEQLSPGIAEGGFGLGVDVGDAGLRVHRKDRVR